MAAKRNDNKIINIAASELRIHPVAQRQLVQSHLKRIVTAMDLDAIGTVHVVYYVIDGVLAYWVIDGQHRVVALQQLGVGDWKVKAEIHRCDSDSLAAELFLKLNRRATVASFDIFANELHAKDPVAVAIYDICTSKGLEIKRQAGNGNIICVGALRTVYRIDDGQTLSETLDVLTMAGGRTKDAVEGRLVEGVGYFISKYKVNLDILATKMAKYPGGPIALLGNAKGLRKLKGPGNSIATCMAEILVDVYNSGRRTGRIEA